MPTALVALLTASISRILFCFRMASRKGGTIEARVATDVGLLGFLGRVLVGLNHSNEQDPTVGQICVSVRHNPL